MAGAAGGPQVLGGKYCVLRVLGEGTYGVVYEAENTWTGGRVAIKTLRRKVGADPRTARRFEQEARIAARLLHPNIVEVLDLGEDPADGSLYIVQALLRGRSLKAVLAQVKRFRPREAVDLLVPVMGAALAMHREGILHRDLKPANIVLATDPARGVRPTLIDFGLSKFVDPAIAAVRTDTGLAMGTPAYMAPEQTRADRDLDVRADVWAFGVILYELLSGTNPFAGPNLGATIVRVNTHTPEPLHQAVTEVSPALSSVVHRALEKAPKRRWQTAAAFIEALLDCEEFEAGYSGRALGTRHTGSLQLRVRGGEESAAAIPLVPGAMRINAPLGDAAPTVWLSEDLKRLVEEATASASGEAALAVDGWNDESVTPVMKRPSRPSGVGASAGGSVVVPVRKGRARWVVGAVLAALVVGLGLAGSTLVPRSPGVHIEVVPTSAVILLDGNPVGRDGRWDGPTDDSRSHEVTLRAEGYEPYQVTFRGELWLVKTLTPLRR
ncbi:MAG: serine/threonine protein kinase [Deltaproteobacteria bacterium]|nr:serine/threonine protein kinase [Deltaproteobacteria bacterium]